MYTKLVGSGNVISGLVSGDYLHIQPTGKIRISGGAGVDYEAAGVFVDKASIRVRHGYGNRFETIAPRTLRVDSLTPYNFIGKSGKWSGQTDVVQDTPNDFSIGMSNGPGVIVKVPATSTGNVVFFHTVNHTSFSTLERDGVANLNFTKIQPAERPRFTVATSQVFTEGQAVAAISISRDNRTQYPVKVNYTVLSGSATGGQNDGDFIVPPNATGTLDFAPGETSKPTYLLGFPNDNVYEGDETMLVRLDIIADDNPNEAYVEASHLTSYTYTLTLKDNDPVPNVYFSASPDVYSGSFAGSFHTEPGSETPINIPIRLSHPSKFETVVWYNYTPSDIGPVAPAVVSGVAAQDGPDFVFGNLPENRSVPIPAGSTTVSIPIILKHDDFYEGLEKIALHLGVDASRGVTNRDSPSGRHVITIQDSSPVPSASLSLMSANSIRRTRWATNTTDLGLVKGYASSANPPAPLIEDTLTRLEMPQTNPDQEYYSQWLRGWIIAPETGDYTFWIASDDNSEFWLSPDKNASGKTLRCSVNGWTFPGEWTKYASQQSATIRLTAGQAYYFETFHQEGAVYDHLAVAWTRPGMAAGTREIIGGSALSSSGDATGAMASASEPDNGAGAKERTILVSLSAASANSTTIPLVFGGTASLGSDYSVPTPSVTIPSGQTTFALPIRVMDDSLVEYDEVITVALAPVPAGGYQGYQAGSPSILALTIKDNDAGDLANTIAPTITKLAGDASANVVVTGFADGTPALALWRIAGEPGWRQSGTSVTGLAAGLHEIEFRPFDGYLAPPTRIINVLSGGTEQVDGENLWYEAIDAPAPVSLRVNLLGATGGQWKLDGETAWRDSGSSLENLPIGSYKIHFNAPLGFQRPAAITRRLNPANAVNEFNIQLIAVPGGIPPKTPAPLSNPETDAMPYSFVGRISTSNGFGTGTAVGPNSVLTAAHVLFDDRTLGYVTDVRYQNQAHKDYYQPSASEELEITGEINAQGFVVNGQSSIKPRGWVMLSGYAERRTEDLDAGMGSGSSGIESQNRDVAVAYFGKPVARGGHIGVRVTDPAVQAAGFWLHSVGPKTLVGYPVTQVAEVNVGKMHASAPSVDITFSQTYLRVFRSNDLVGGPGISGGPLIIRGSEDSSEFDWKVGAVYLGESVFGVYREIDKDVADIIGYAQLLSGDDSAGDKNPIANTNRSTDIAQLEVRCNQPAASWRNGASPLPRRMNNPITLQDMDFEVRFSDLDGWITPSVIRGRGLAGKNTVVTGRYVAKSYGTLATALAIHYPGAPVEVLSPMGDLNQNGTPNMIEWASNLDPLGPATPKTLTPSTGTSGLPFISVVGADPVRRLKVEFVQMKSAVNPNLRYVPEFSSSLDENSWTASGQLISRASIDDVWERVVMEDRVLNAPTRFARLRVEEIPASN